MSVPCSHSRLYGPPWELLPHPLHGLMLRDDFRIVADGRSPATGIGSVRAHFCTPWKNRALLLCGSQGHVNCRTLEIHRLERHVFAFRTASFFGKVDRMKPGSSYIHSKCPKSVEIPNAVGSVSPACTPVGRNRRCVGTGDIGGLPQKVSCRVFAHTASCFGTFFVRWDELAFALMPGTQPVSAQMKEHPQSAGC